MGNYHYQNTISGCNDSETSTGIYVYISSFPEASLLRSIMSWLDPGQRLWDHLVSRIVYLQRLGRKSICYDALGCFHVRGLLSHLRRVPDHPRKLQTGLWICTRANPDPLNATTQLITFDKNSLEDSVFDPGLPVKIIVHGYGGQYKSPNVIAAKNAILQADNANVVLVNWQRAAKGQYSRAVSNAELVGRQVGKTLVAMVTMGTNASDIHVIGFSLGAQVAGFIGETLKSYGLKLGRITDNNANSSGVCSHGRSWGIFLEMLTSKHCQFLGFSCPGLRDFQRDFLHGNCFRSCDEDTSACGVMGQVGRARGSLYLVTRPTSPYCGQQLRASVWISPMTLLTRGVLQMKLHHGATATDFSLNLSSLGVIEGGREMSVVAAAKPGSVSVENNLNLTATITFTPSRGMMRIGGQQHIFLDRISLMDHHGNSWQHCGENLLLEDKIGTSSDSITLQLTQTPCL
ncbi:uncharacterized protein LOC111875625 isoform X2 [Cryptotermes secundus]|uniref:uncharacterized protein LOC111875625 isoform X2 n=1 Tax=Cryptotermes secundus TaxID=105785 RepID=UPI001454CE73|nr:uncharacterized protein LOC111875625 isoform X2 [Cryptotermes secundus]